MVGGSLISKITKPIERYQKFKSPNGQTVQRGFFNALRKSLFVVPAVAEAAM